MTDKLTSFFSQAVFLVVPILFTMLFIYVIDSALILVGKEPIVWGFKNLIFASIASVFISLVLGALSATWYGHIHHKELIQQNQVRSLIREGRR